MEYSSIKIIRFMKVTKIKQEIDYDVIAANAHQVKTAPLFYKLPTTGKDIMLTLVMHQNIPMDPSHGNDISMDKPGYS